MRFFSGFVVIFAITLCLVLQGTHAAPDAGPFYVNPSSRSVEVIFGLRCVECTKDHVFNVVVPRTEIARIKAIDFIAVHDTTGKLVVDTPFTVKVSPAGGASTDTVGRFTVPFTAPLDLERDDVFVFTGVVKFSSVSGIGTQTFGVTQADTVSEIAIVSYEAPAKEIIAQSPYAYGEGKNFVHKLSIYVADIAIAIDGFYILLNSNTGGSRADHFAIDHCAVNGNAVNVLIDQFERYVFRLDATLPKGLDIIFTCELFLWGAVTPEQATVGVGLLAQGTDADQEFIPTHALTTPIAFKRVISHAAVETFGVYHSTGLAVMNSFLLPTGLDKRDYLRVRLHNAKNIDHITVLQHINVEDATVMPDVFQHDGEVKLTRGVSDRISFPVIPPMPEDGSPLLLSVAINVEMKDVDLKKVVQPVIEFVRHFDIDPNPGPEPAPEPEPEPEPTPIMSTETLSKVQRYTIHQYSAVIPTSAQPLAQDVSFDIHKEKSYIAEFSINIKKPNVELFNAKDTKIFISNPGLQYWFSAHEHADPKSPDICTLNDGEIGQFTVSSRGGIEIELTKPFPTDAKEYILACPKLRFVTREDASNSIKRSRNTILFGFADAEYMNADVVQVNDKFLLVVPIWAILILVVLSIVIIVGIIAIISRRTKAEQLQLSEATESLIQ